MSVIAQPFRDLLIAYLAGTRTECHEGTDYVEIHYFRDADPMAELTCRYTRKGILQVITMEGVPVWVDEEAGFIPWLQGRWERAQSRKTYA